MSTKGKALDEGGLAHLAADLLSSSDVHLYRNVPGRLPVASDDIFDDESNHDAARPVAGLSGRVKRDSGSVRPRLES